MIAHAVLEILRDDVAITAALQESGVAAHHMPSALNAAKKIQDTGDLIDRFIQRVELQQSGITLTLSLASLMAPEMNSIAITIVRDIPM